jgi:uncharacterized cupin superfamily protein
MTIDLIAEAELSDGTLAVVEDVLNEGSFHVYKGVKNVQPRHDAKGIMRYLMVVIHALGHKSDKLAKEKEQLEKKVKLLEELTGTFDNKGDPIKFRATTGDWEMLYVVEGGVYYRRKNDIKSQFAVDNNELLKAIYKAEGLE